MFKFLNLNPEIFGIDINDLSIKIIKLKKKASGFSLASFNDVPISPGIVKDGAIIDQDALAKIITMACNTVKGEKLDTKYAVVSLPEEKSFFQLIQMPKMELGELRSAVPHEAENYIPLTIDKVYLDFQIIDQHANNHGHLDLLVNVMPKPIVDAYVSCFKKAGIIPCVLEVESQAIVRALIKKDEKNSSTIFIDFGQTKTSFIIFSENSIRFTSSIPISSSQLTDTISEKLGVTFNKAEELKIKYGLNPSKDERYDIKKVILPILNDLVVQVKKYISFYQGHAFREHSPSDDKIEKIVLCGGGVNLKGFAEFIFKELKIPVEIGSPFVNVFLQKNVTNNLIPPQKALSFTTALGLALRGASDQGLNDDTIL